MNKCSGKESIFTDHLLYPVIILGRNNYPMSIGFLYNLSRVIQSEKNDKL